MSSGNGLFYNYHSPLFSAVYLCNATVSYLIIRNCFLDLDAHVRAAHMTF